MTSGATTAMPQKDTQVRPKKRKLLHPLMPPPMHKPQIIRWLKRFHAWFGVFGAVAGLLFGLTGFILNHRVDFRVGAENVESKYTIPAPAERSFADGDAFGHYVREQMELNGQPRAPAMGGGRGAAVPGGTPIAEPMQFLARFPAASQQISAKYERGSDTIEITEQAKPTIRTLNAMHRGIAPNAGWKIFVDVYAGVLIFLCLSGILIWSRLSGTRLVGGGLLFSSFSLIMYWMLAGP